MSEQADLQVPILATETEIKALVEVLDVACKAGGIAVAERAAFWVQKLDRALNVAKATDPAACDDPETSRPGREPAKVVPLSANIEARHGAS